MSLRRRSSSSITSNETTLRNRTSITVQAPEAASTSPISTSTNRASLISFSQLVVVALFSILPLMPSMFLQHTVDLVRDEVRVAQEKSEQALWELNEAVDRKKQLKDTVKELELENAQLLTTLKRHGNMVDPDNNLYKLAEKDEEVYMQRIDELEKSVQLWSKLRLEQKFPSAIQQNHHQLKFQFTLLNWDDQTSQTFVIETFPLEDAAHTIAVFEETVTEKILLNSAPTLEVGTHATCINLQARTSDASQEKVETIRFVEQSTATQMREGQYNVLMGRRGFQPVVVLCAGKAERGLNDRDIESVFATVVSGTEFLESMIQPADEVSAKNNRGWRLQSIEHVFDESNKKQ